MLDKRGGSHRQKAGGAPRGGRSLGLQSYKTRVRIPHSTLISDVCLPLSVWGRGGAVWEEDRTPVDLLRSLC